MFLITGIFKNFKAKLKSPIFWISIVLLILQQFNVPETLINDEQAILIINVIFRILTVLGFVNNPEDNYFVRKEG